MGMTDRQRLIDLLMDNLPDDSPGEGQIVKLVDVLMEHGVTFRVAAPGHEDQYNIAEMAYNNGYAKGMEDGSKNRMPIHPCQGCVYYKVCGESTRTSPCYGRMTERERRKDNE